MTTQLVNILDEDFEIPPFHADLLQIIEVGIEYYESINVNTRHHKEYRHKLNELIDEYNEMRGHHILNRVK